MPRLLAATRISRDTENSASLLTQEADLRQYAAANRHELVDVVIDATVSGKVNIAQRRALGRWLEPPLIDSWDVLAFASQDRITRDDLAWNKFVALILDNAKQLVVLDDPALDLETTDGRMMAGIRAGFAAKYLEAVAEKRRRQIRYHYDHDLWIGGIWPLAYRPERFIFDPSNGGRGGPRYRLVVDPPRADLVLEAVERLLRRGDSLGDICDDFTRRGILTQKHYQYAETGKPPPGPPIPWRMQVLRRQLVSPALRGFAVSNEEPRRRDGRPIQWAPEVLTASRAAEVRDVLTAKPHKKGRRKGRHPLIGLLFCSCGRGLHQSGSGKWLTFACDSWCEAMTRWLQQDLLDEIDAAVTGAIGDYPIFEHRYVAGVSHEAEITELRESVANLAVSLARLSGAAAAEVERLLNEYSAELERLESEPTVAARTELVDTGRSYRQEWSRFGGDWKAKAALLRRSGLRFVFQQRGERRWFYAELPGDFSQRLNLTVSTVDIPVPDGWSAIVTDIEGGGWILFRD